MPPGSIRNPEREPSSGVQTPIGEPLRLGRVARAKRLLTRVPRFSRLGLGRAPLLSAPSMRRGSSRGSTVEVRTPRRVAAAGVWCASRPCLCRATPRSMPPGEREQAGHPARYYLRYLSCQGAHYTSRQAPELQKQSSEMIHIPPSAQDFYDQEDIVAKLYTLHSLETRSPYRPALASASMPFWHRISAAIENLPEEHQPGAMALFANSFYLTQPMMDAGWQCLAALLCQYLDCDLTALPARVAFFQQRDEVFLEHFQRVNNLPGREDKGRFPPLHTPEAFVSAADPASHDHSTAQQLFDRPYWVLLTDLSMSGTTVNSDLDKLESVRRKHSLRLRETQVIVCTVVLTSDARTRILGKTASSNLHYAYYLDESLKLTSEECALFACDATRNRVLSLCEWYYKTIFIHDPDQGQAIEDSQSRFHVDMRYGFAGGAYALVTHANCPNNSVPLLWHNPASSLFVPPYRGPWPRLLPRVVSAAHSLVPPLNSANPETPHL